MLAPCLLKVEHHMAILRYFLTSILILLATKDLEASTSKDLVSYCQKSKDIESLLYFNLPTGSDFDRDYDCLALVKAAASYKKLTIQEPIASLDFLKMTPTLEELSIEVTEKLDLSPIYQLQDLKVFHCANCPAIDFASFRSKTSLTEIHLDSYVYWPKREYKDWPQLQSFHCLYCADVPIDFIKSLTRLQELITGVEANSDLFFLRSRQTLKILNLHGDNLRNLDSIYQLPQLKKLSVSFDGLDLKRLQNTTLLESLSISSPKTLHLNELMKFKSLKELRLLAGNSVALDALLKLPQLEKLELDVQDIQLWPAFSGSNSLSFKTPRPLEQSRKHQSPNYELHYQATLDKKTIHFDANTHQEYSDLQRAKERFPQWVRNFHFHSASLELSKNGRSYRHYRFQFNESPPLAKESFTSPDPELIARWAAWRKGVYGKRMFHTSTKGSVFNLYFFRY